MLYKPVVIRGVKVTVTPNELRTIDLARSYIEGNTWSRTVTPEDRRLIGYSIACLRLYYHNTEGAAQKDVMITLAKLRTMYPQSEPTFSVFRYTSPPNDMWHGILSAAYTLYAHSVRGEWIHKANENVNYALAQLSRGYPIIIRTVHLVRYLQAMYYQDGLIRQHPANKTTCSICRTQKIKNRCCYVCGFTPNANRGRLRSENFEQPPRTYSNISVDPSAISTNDIRWSFASSNSPSHPNPFFNDTTLQDGDSE